MTNDHDHDHDGVPHEDEVYCLTGAELDRIHEMVCEAAETASSEPYTAGKVDGARAFHYLVVNHASDSE